MVPPCCSKPRELRSRAPMHGGLSTRAAPSSPKTSSTPASWQLTLTTKCWRSAGGAGTARRQAWGAVLTKKRASSASPPPACPASTSPSSWAPKSTTRAPTRLPGWRPPPCKRWVMMLSASPRPPPPPSLPPPPPPRPPPHPPPSPAAARPSTLTCWGASCSCIQRLWVGLCTPFRSWLLLSPSLSSPPPAARPPWPPPPPPPPP